MIGLLEVDHPLCIQILGVIESLMNGNLKYAHGGWIIQLAGDTLRRISFTKVENMLKFSLQ